MNYQNYKLDKVRDELVPYYRPDGIDIANVSMLKMVRDVQFADDIEMRGSVANYFENNRKKVLTKGEVAEWIMNGIPLDKFDDAAKMFKTTTERMYRATMVTKIENLKWDWDVLKYRYGVLCQMKRLK